jgi:hypothetical protein
VLTLMGGEMKRVSLRLDETMYYLFQRSLSSACIGYEIVK